MRKYSSKKNPSSVVRGASALCVSLMLLSAAIMPPAMAGRNSSEPASEQLETSGSGSQHKTPLYKGGVTYTIPKDTPFKLKLATVPTNGMRLLDRDLDGNLLPAKVGDKISAKTTEDLYVDNNKVIPEGTIFYGVVTQVNAPRHVNRPGSLALKFGSFETPDGRMFEFHAEADNKKESTIRSKAKGLGGILGFTGGGAIVGALVAYQIFGLHQTIAMHGYNIAGGAAGGALLATAYAIWRKGPKATLEPGDDLNMTIDTDLLMPAAVEPTHKKHVANLPGLEIQIHKSKVKSDGFTGHILRLDCSIYNNSNKPLRSIDLFVEDSNGNRYPLCAGDAEEGDLVFTVDAHTMRSATLFFQVEYPKLKRHLVWLNHGNRQICFKESLPK